MTNEPSVLYTVSKKVARVIMNRPAAMNAMSRGMITELRKTLEHAQHDPEVALIVLSGAGANFCAGDDLKEAEQQTSEEFLALIMDLQHLTRLLMGEKPTIAAVDGYAVGGGFELALACDFRVATTRVRLGCVETRVGMVITGGASVLLPTLVGQAHGTRDDLHGKHLRRRCSPTDGADPSPGRSGIVGRRGTNAHRHTASSSSPGHMREQAFAQPPFGERIGARFPE